MQTFEPFHTPSQMTMPNRNERPAAQDARRRNSNRPTERYEDKARVGIGHVLTTSDARMPDSAPFLAEPVFYPCT